MVNKADLLLQLDVYTV